MQTVDAIILSRFIIPIEPENTVLENHVLVIDQGKIKAILPYEKALKEFNPKEKIVRDNHVILPGFINAHAHTPMTLFRGLADDLPLMKWLQEYIWPAEKKWLSDEFCYAGTRLAILEMIRSGTTCFNDNYFFLEGIINAAEEMEMNASLGVCIIDFETAYGKKAEDYLLRAEQFYERLKKHDFLSLNIAPHAPYSVSDQTFEKVRNIAEAYNLPIQVHLQETQGEVEESIKQCGKRPVKRLFELGILSEKTQAIHMTQINEEDINYLQQTKTHVIHCPESNLKLASGFCPVDTLQKAGINVGLGTDGTASNNDLDMLGELKIAALLAKAVAKDPTAVSAFNALKMATLNSAKAMQIDHKTGSLLPKKSADFIAIDLSAINTQPLYNPISQIVYAASYRQISDVWIRGKHKIKNYLFTDIDAQAILDAAKIWQERIVK